MKMNAFKLALVVSVSVSALGVATEAFAGQENKVYVIQFNTGSGNRIDATQVGNYNLFGAPYPTSSTSKVYYFQQAKGGGNVADTYQSGDHNKLGFNAAGNPAASNTFGQYGAGNTFWAHQAISSNRLGVFTQQGASNTAVLYQSGNGNQVDSLTQKGVGSTTSAPTGGNNYASVWIMGDNNGGSGTLATGQPHYIGTTSTHSVDEIDAMPPSAFVPYAPTYVPYVVSGLGVTSFQLNGLANLDQTGASNYAVIGFQGNGNRFNLTQISDNSATDKTQANTFLAGANGKELYDGTSTTPMPLIGDSNYVYGYQNGSGNVFTLNANGGTVSNAVVLISQSGIDTFGSPGAVFAGTNNKIFWKTSSNTYYEGIQFGAGNTVTGGISCTTNCSPHTALTYQAGVGNSIVADIHGGVIDTMIDLYQEGTANSFVLYQEGPHQAITGTQIGLMNVAAVDQRGSHNTINISQH